MSLKFGILFPQNSESRTIFLKKLSVLISAKAGLIKNELLMWVGRKQEPGRAVV